MSRGTNKLCNGLVECYANVIKTNKPSLIVSKTLNVVMLSSDEYTKLIEQQPTKSAKEMFEDINYIDNGNRNDESELCLYESIITKSIGNEFYQQGIFIIIYADYTVEKIEDNGTKLCLSFDEVKAITQQLEELEVANE